MPAYTTGISRDKIYFCLINVDSFLRFKTKDYLGLPGVSINEFNPQLLGLTETPPSGKIILVTPSSPKPPRVTRRIRNTDLDANTQDTISTYCNALNLQNVIRPGIWNLAAPATNVSLRNDAASTSIILPIQKGNGVLHYYVMPKNTTDYNLYKGDLNWQSSILVNTEAERRKLVSGSSKPHPGYAVKHSTKNRKKTTSRQPFGDGLDLLNGWFVVKESVALS